MNTKATVYVSNIFAWLLDMQEGHHSATDLRSPRTWEVIFLLHLNNDQMVYLSPVKGWISRIYSSGPGILI